MTRGDIDMKRESVNFNIPNWAIQYFGYSGAVIFSMIYNSTNSSRKYFDGSINYIIEKSGKSRRTIMRHLKELEEIGAIKRIGYNSYRNVKYISCVDKNSVAKCQNDTIEGAIQSAKIHHEQSAKMTPLNAHTKITAKCQNDTLQSAKMTPHKNIINKKTINNIDKSNINCKDINITDIIISSNEDMSSYSLDDVSKKEDEKMQYKIHEEDSYDKSQAGWWKHYIFFPDNEELNDLFIKLLDKTAEEEKNYIDGCSTAYEIVSAARLKTLYSDEQLSNMSDEEFNSIPESDLQPVDVTNELIDVLRDFAYNNNRERLNTYLGLTA